MVEVALEVTLILLKPILRHTPLASLDQPLLLLFLLVGHLDLLGPALEAFGATVLEVVVEEAVTPLVEGSEEFVASSAGWLGLVTRVVRLTLVLKEERLGVLGAVGGQRGRVQWAATGGRLVVAMQLRGQDRLT